MKLSALLLIKLESEGSMSGSSQVPRAWVQDHMLGRSSVHGRQSWAEYSCSLGRQVSREMLRKAEPLIAPPCPSGKPFLQSERVGRGGQVILLSAFRGHSFSFMDQDGRTEGESVFVL